MNIMLIIAAQTREYTVSRDYCAAKLCADYVITECDVPYGDWYLPSKYELNLIYENLHQPGIAEYRKNYDTRYWSSTQRPELSSYMGAWTQDFADGSQESRNVSLMFRLIPIRKF